MKKLAHKALFAALLSLLTFQQAQAGAWGFNCSNAFGTFTVQQGEATFREYGQGSDESEAVEAVWKGYESEALNQPPQNPNKAVEISVVGKIKTVAKKDFVDECNHQGYEETFIVKVIARGYKSKKTKAKDTLICVESYVSGHCT